MLVEPVSLRPVSQLGAVHFVAIGGSGMAPIALLYKESGVVVTGSDRFDSPTMDALREAGITVYVGHDAAQLGAARTVVVSSAIPDDNPELDAARRLGLRVWHRSAALGALLLGRRGVAVTGTHGKTTTSAMTATALSATGDDPGYVVGSVLADTGRASSLGTGADFVVEADESDGSFRQYPVETFVVTNIEADHLDNWGTPEAYYAGYGEAVRGDTVRQVVACTDDPGAARLVAELRAEERRVVTYGTSHDADLRIEEPRFEGSGASARLVIADESFDLVLGVPGLHNLRNASAAVAVGLLRSIPADQSLAALRDFHGTSRRFELVGRRAGVTVYDDYAHHPTEVEAALTAARTVAGTGRVIACFQPHLFSRTRTFAAEFAAALGLADEIVVCPIYPAREKPIPGVTSALITDRLRDAGRHVHVAASLDGATDLLRNLARKGDLVVTLGAGDVTRVGPLVLKQGRT
jgi:UDP-N-acetylmuramate--alanine ligase